MEKKYINWQGNTHFYVDLVNKEYGVRVNVEDTPNALKLIQQELEKNRDRIQCLKQLWAGGVE